MVQRLPAHEGFRTKLQERQAVSDKVPLNKTQFPAISNTPDETRSSGKGY
jgi:hypothetical protein